MTDDSYHMNADEALTGRAADDLDRERALDPATGEALRDVQTHTCPTCDGMADDCPECDGRGRVRGADPARRGGHL